MIRINLLPTRAIKKKEDISKQVLVFIFSMIFVGSGMFFYYYQLNSQHNILLKEKDEKQKLLEKYKDISKKIANIQTKLTNVQKRISLINNLSMNRSSIIRLIDQITNAIPTQKAFLKRITEAKGIINLDGTAKDNETVATFMVFLNSQPDIKNVMLKGTTLTKLPNTNEEVVDFGLVCETIYKPVEPKPATKPAAKK